MQLTFTDWYPRRRKPFGTRACRAIRVRLLREGPAFLPRSWREHAWIIARIKATPPWADMRAIKAVYDEAARLDFETGIKHHVDHIVPLNHPLVCGLHVDWNLRVIPARPNMAKGNRWMPEQLELFNEQ